MKTENMVFWFVMPTFQRTLLHPSSGWRKTEAARSSKTLVACHIIVQCHDPEDHSTKMVNFCPIIDVSLTFCFLRLSMSCICFLNPSSNSDFCFSSRFMTTATSFSFLRVRSRNSLSSCSCLCTMVRNFSSSSSERFNLTSFAFDVCTAIRSSFFRVSISCKREPLFC